MDLGKIISEAIAGFIKYIADSIIDIVMQMLVDIQKTSTIIMDMDIIDNVIQYAQLLAFALLLVKTVVEGFGIYVLYQNGDPDISPAKHLSRAIQAGVAIAAMPTVIRIVYKFSINISSDIISIYSGNMDLRGAVETVVLSPLIGIILILIVLISLVVIIVQVSIRGAELSLMLITAPMFSLNLTTEGRNLFGSFLRHVFSIALTQCIQIFLVRAMMVTAWGIGITGDPIVVEVMRILLILAWAFLTIKTPKFLNEIIYSAGISNIVITAGRTALYKL